MIQSYKETKKMIEEIAKRTIVNKKTGDKRIIDKPKNNKLINY